MLKNGQTTFSSKKHHYYSITLRKLGNEYGIIALFVSQRVIAFYKPISDTTIDNIMLNIRSAFGLELYPIEQTMRVMNHLKDENILYVFIGDQTPLNMNGVYWNTFLHQATPWLTGAEKLAKNTIYLCYIFSRFRKLNVTFLIFCDFILLLKIRVMKPVAVSPKNIAEYWKTR